MVRRHAARSATKETLARARTCKTERFRRFFASKATKGRARILLLPQIGGLAELVYCTGLENQRAVKSPKGSNPLASSFLMRCSPAATRADCKSAAIRLRGFESRHLNDGSIVRKYSSVGRMSVSKTEGRRFEPFCFCIVYISNSLQCEDARVV